MLDLLIKNAKVFHEGSLQELEIAVKDGKIVKLARVVPHEQAEVEVDAKGSLALPAGIDVHVHFRDPGHTYKETWHTGSCAAAAGGITTVIDQPNTTPPTLDARSFKKKLRRASRLSVIDFGINGGLTEKNLGKLDVLKEAGVMGFGEVFMGESTNASAVDMETLKAALEEISSLGLFASVHAEDMGIIERSEPEARKNQVMYHALARPPAAEAKAVMDVVNLATSLKELKLHLCHLSTSEGVGMVRNAKYVGMRTTCEVTPHHLLLSESDFKRLGSRSKVNPPLRSVEHVQALWRGLRSGTIDVLASDHAPHRLSEKEQHVFDAPSGIPGVETLMPLTLGCVMRNYLSLKRAVEAMCTAPAELFSMHGKGRIALGFDADIALFDTRHIERVDAERLHSKAGWSPYEGMEAVFPKLTVSRGEVVFDGLRGEDVVGEKGRGRWITPAGFEHEQ
ncbi:MAG: dihydroorotase [Methermicoccaceae archaeon]